MKKIISKIISFNIAIAVFSAITACPPGKGLDLGPALMLLGVSGAPAAVSGYAIGGQVSGLAAGQSALLTLNNGTPMTVKANGVFAFPTRLENAETYNVQAEIQPVAENLGCTAGNNVGTVAGADISNISVICGTTHTLSVQVTDLDSQGALGTGLTFINNGGAATSVTTFSTPVAFTVPVTEGASYSVAVASQPTSPIQTCSPLSATDGTGTMPTSAHTVTFGCSTTKYTISANVSGLAGNNLILENNGNNTDQLTPAADGTYSFTAKVAEGLPYAVTIAQQPSNLSQTCTLGANSSGTATTDVTVDVTCVTNQYTVSGTVSGLGTDESVVLRINDADNQTVTYPATAFSFGSVVDGTGYIVSIYTKPDAKFCSITNDTGTLAGANVTNVSVSCIPCLGGTTAKSAVVNWDASRSYDVKTAASGGYKIYYSTSPGVSTSTPNVIDVPNTLSTTTRTIPNLQSGCTYYLKVGAYSAINTDASASLSAETSFTIN